MPGSTVKREQVWAVGLAALACLALGILASLDAVTHVERYTEVRTVDPWSETGTFVYEPILADGTGTLAMGEPGYFTHDAPTVRIRFTWRLDDPTAERVSALGSLRLVVHQDAAAGRPAWTYEEELASVAHHAGAALPLVLEGALDLPAAATRAESAPQRHAEDATWTIVASVRFETAPGVHRADASPYELPLTYAAPLYVLPDVDDLAETKDHATREASLREEGGGPRALVASPGGPLLLLLGVAGLAYAAPRFPRTLDATSADDEEAAA